MHVMSVKVPHSCSADCGLQGSLLKGKKHPHRKCRITFQSFPKYVMATNKHQYLENVFIKSLPFHNSTPAQLVVQYYQIHHVPAQVSARFSFSSNHYSCLY